jgi:hypothetical protein
LLLGEPGARVTGPPYGVRKGSGPSAYGRGVGDY